MEGEDVNKFVIFAQCKYLESTHFLDGEANRRSPFQLR